MTKPRETFARLRGRHAAWVTPAPSGLPRLRVMLAFPAVLLVLGAILVGLAVNGSSSGAYFTSVQTGTDPDLIAGSPQTIRSDEWNTGTAWIISQIQQGLPDRNETFPGGMDAALPYDLPRLDWSVAFRPHLIGYLVLDADHGTAWRWWSSAFALIAATYVFLVTLLPRRPVAAALISVAFFYSPFFQWWFQSSTFWPVVWTLITMASLVWALKSDSRLSRWIWAAIVAYLTGVMALGIYIPYIIPSAYLVAFFAAGLVVNELRSGTRVVEVVKRAIPTLVAGAVGVAVTGYFLVVRASAVEGFASTVYPGERLTPAGEGSIRAIIATVASSFTEALDRGDGFLDENSSEASSFFLIGLFMLPFVVLIVRQSRRRGIRLDWTLVTVSFVALVFVAFMVVPGWDAVAHLLFLDRIPFERFRIGLGVASLVLLALLVKSWDEREEKTGRLFALAVAALFLVSQAAVAALIIKLEDAATLWTFSPGWIPIALASAGAIYFFARRRTLLASALLVLATVPASFLVNPIYVGVLDLRESEPGQQVIATDAGAEGAWVGIGGPVVSAILIESGVEAYNGVQGAPSEEMWHRIDPDGQYERKWNRIGFINWMQAPGEPVVTNPVLDGVVVTFDGCSDFAQENVRYVFTDHPIDDACLALDTPVETDTADFQIYEVVAPGSR